MMVLCWLRSAIGWMVGTCSSPRNMVLDSQSSASDMHGGSWCMIREQMFWNTACGCMPWRAAIWRRGGEETGRTTRKG